MNCSCSYVEISQDWQELIKSSISSTLWSPFGPCRQLKVIWQRYQQKYVFEVIFILTLQQSKKAKN